ncbi:MAG: type secretion system-associated lipoprotein [Burkholderiaceae bacterium]|nr:type secretion system-associated lipoprotein [Burkholderiaceae bacterium]
MNQDVVHRHGRQRREFLRLAGAAGVAVLTGCGSAPKPVVVKLTIEASADANPDTRGRPSPVTVKLFELKSSASFEKADFFSLFDRERETLGPELVGWWATAISSARSGGSRFQSRLRARGRRRFKWAHKGFR